MQGEETRGGTREEERWWAATEDTRRALASKYIIFTFIDWKILEGSVSDGQSLHTLCSAIFTVEEHLPSICEAPS